MQEASEKSSLMKNTSTSARHWSGKEPRRYQRERTLEHVDLSKRTHKRLDRSILLFERSGNESLNMSILHVKKARVRREENVLIDMTRQREARAKELDQEAWLNTTIPRKNAWKMERTPSRQEDRPPCFNYKNCSND